MNLNEQVLQKLLENPGTPKSIIAEMFGLSHYRLHRIFRHIERGLQGQALVHQHNLGVWIVDADPSKCKGMIWTGCNSEGYRQCSNDGEFPDGRCYEHSECEASDMVAFHRRLSYLAGPGDPSVRSLSQLALESVQELLSILEAIVPLTLKDLNNKGDLFRLLSAARSVLAWKDRMRMRQTQRPIPPEFRARFTHATVNPFEYSLRKYFAVLELPVDADRDQVLRAWKQLALRYHPDVQGNDGDEEKMKAINLAKDRIFGVRGWE
jgi:hypothetical protein